MKSLLTLILATVCASFLTGCASGPKYSEMKSTLPRVPADQGRLFFYRTALLGAAVQPDVNLNDTKVGNAVPGGFFYVDRAPGNYVVQTSTEVTRRLSLTLDKGATRFIRLNMRMGFWVGRVDPELVDTATGEEEIAGCGYTGSK
jgi:hypothetical protein